MTKKGKRGLSSAEKSRYVGTLTENVSHTTNVGQINEVLDSLHAEDSGFPHQCRVGLITR